MPLLLWLGSFLSSAFVTLIAFFSAFVTKKIAIGVALGAFLVAGWVALQSAMYLAWASLGWIMPAGMSLPLSFVGYLLPSNTSICIEVIVLARIGRWLWDVQSDWARAMAVI